jgi:hypothetical protein
MTEILHLRPGEILRGAQGANAVAAPEVIGTALLCAALWPAAPHAVQRSVIG